jgi:hypothetical protein
MLTHGRAAAELLTHDAEPLEDYPGLASPWQCRCLLCGQHTTLNLKYLRKRYSRAHKACPAYNRRTRILPEETARAIMLAARLVPMVPYPGSKARWLCRCLVCGQEVTPIYNTVQQNNHGCRWCGVERRRRLRMRDPLEMDFSYRRLGGIPETSYPGVDEVWPGVCVEGAPRMSRTWKAIEKSGYFCTYCAGSRVRP